MTESTPYRHTCAWPKCENQPWWTANLEICGGHAKAARDAIKPMEDTAAADRERQLRAVIREQQERINALTVQLSEKPKPQPPSPTKHGTVYILRCGGYVKIGWTADLDKRMKSYQPDTVLLATMPGTRADEANLHKRFAHLRTHGREWYPLAPQITEYAATVVAKHGEPDTVTFAAKPVTIPQPRPKQYTGGNYRGNHQTGVVWNRLA